MKKTIYLFLCLSVISCGVNQNDRSTLNQFKTNSTKNDFTLPPSGNPSQPLVLKSTDSERPSFDKMLRGETIKQEKPKPLFDFKKPEHNYNGSFGYQVYKNGVLTFEKMQGVISKYNSNLQYTPSMPITATYNTLGPNYTSWMSEGNVLYSYP